jgi:hypothetical protein
VAGLLFVVLVLVVPARGKWREAPKGVLNVFGLSNPPSGATHQLPLAGAPSAAVTSSVVAFSDTKVATTIPDKKRGRL